MLLIDDLMLAPGRFLVWVARQVRDAARKELDQEAQQITARLGELHRRLETGAIDEREFAARERELLDRFDELEADGADDAEERDGGAA